MMDPNSTTGDLLPAASANPPPAPDVHSLPSNVVADTDTVASSTIAMPPPKYVAALPTNVQFDSSDVSPAVRLMSTPPPAPLSSTSSTRSLAAVALLRTKRVQFTVSVSPLEKYSPPPLLALFSRSSQS